MFRISVPFEIKGVDENTLEGLGSTFGNVDLGGDIMMPGSFKRSLATHREKGTMPAMLWQHDTTQVPGAWTEAKETEDGLMLKGEFADTQLGRETRTLGRMRAVRGLSIGGFLMDFDFDDDGNRIIKEFDLWETSIVTFPMNPQATIAAVKAANTPRTLERALRDAGCTRTEAKDITSSLFGGMPTGALWDAEDDELAEITSLLEKSTRSMECAVLESALRK